MLIALMVFGALLLAVWAFKLLAFISRNTLRCQKNIYGLYGLSDTWAVVTGGSDGIGEQFCHQLAEKGFNICIISRNKSKMIEKLEEIKKSAPREIKTKCIVADFS
jgi:17beta-estradiol 17-dehydrogenase / very-long-chain 3-oxoacyl-CoA reductase